MWVKNKGMKTLYPQICYKLKNSYPSKENHYSTRKVSQPRYPGEACLDILTPSSLPPWRCRNSYEPYSLVPCLTFPLLINHVLSIPNSLWINLLSWYSSPQLTCHCPVGALRVRAGDPAKWREGHFHDSETQGIPLIWTLQKILLVWPFSSFRLWLLGRHTGSSAAEPTLPLSPIKCFLLHLRLLRWFFKSHLTLLLFLTLSQMSYCSNDPNPLHRKICPPRSLEDSHLVALNGHPSLGTAWGKNRVPFPADCIQLPNSEGYKSQ